MALKTRVQPISRDLELFLSEDLGPKARSAMLAAFAAETIEEAKQQNKQVLGAVPPYEVFVDGREGAPLTSVKPDGVIRAEFELVNEALIWIYQQLETHSPRLTGQYASSHVLFADGAGGERDQSAARAGICVRQYHAICPQDRGHQDAGRHHRRRRRMASTRRSPRSRASSATSPRSRSLTGLSRAVNAIRQSS